MKNHFPPIIRKFLLGALILTGIAACKKEKPVTPAAKMYPDTIQVGVYDYKLYEFVSMEPSSLVKEGMTNIDITNDGIPDFRLITHNEDELPDGHSNATLSIETLNPDCYIFTDSIYVIPLAAEASLTVTHNWKQGVLTLLNRTYTCCPATPHIYEGLWQDKLAFVGIRYKNRLGWIKVGVVMGNCTKIYGFGLSK